MVINTDNIFPRLVLKQYDLAPPSRLAHLEPIGLETPYTESLTSYISRLAEIHSQTVGSLFICELVPAAGQKYLSPKSKKNESPLSSSFIPAIPGLVGCGKIAEDWVQILERLTLRRDLRYLTMLTWRDVFPTGAAAKPDRAWCPACLKEQKESGKIVYEHLLWAQQYVHVCPLHRCRLSTQCPHCGRRLRALANKTRPGHCSSCGNWLGAVEKEGERECVNQDLMDAEVRAAEQIGRLIDGAPSLLLAPGKETVISAVRKCVERCAGDFIPGFARHFGIGTLTVRSWLNYNSVPRFDFLLKICKVLGLSLFEFFTDDEFLDRVGVKERVALISMSAKRDGVRRRSVDLRNAMLELLKEEPPISPTEAASRLGYKSPAAFVKRHSDLYQQLKDRYDAYIKGQTYGGNGKGQKRGRRERLHDDDTIRKALEWALAQDPPPSLDSVAKSLGYDSTSPLTARFPDLSKELVERSRVYKANRESELKRALEEALSEEPPPSIYAVAIRLGYTGAAGIEQRFPELSEKIKTRYRQWKQDETLRIQKALEAALEEEEARSMRSVAKSIGYNYLYLRQLFPDLCEKISKRFKKHTQEKIMLKKREEGMRVRRTAIKLIAKGEYPSAARIRKELGGPLKLKTSELAAVLRDIRHELGVKRRLKPGC